MKTQMLPLEKNARKDSQTKKQPSQKKLKCSKCYLKYRKISVNMYSRALKNPDI